MKERKYRLLKAKSAIKLIVNNRKNKPQTMPIKVVFLVQYVPAWNKFEGIYNEMLESSKFQTYIVCVPNDINNSVLADGINDTYDYFVEQGYDVINSIDEKGKWFDLQQLNPQYVFYTRPYNMYLPKQYNSSVVSKYSKVSNMMYATNLSVDTVPVLMNIDFFKDVRVFFAECEYVKQYFKKLFPISTLLGIRKVLYEGVPALEQVIKDKTKATKEWDFYQGKYRIIWTPRWTTDVNLGGSNFFVYQLELLKFAKDNPQISLMIRPHPLMFNNFVNTGEMTIDEVNYYKESINKIDNVVLNESKEYDAILWNSDIMISDISGIMPEYFVTGKPIIFCASNMSIALIDYAKKILEGCYIAYTKEEMFSYLKQLIRGEDPLKPKREALIDELFGNNIGDVSKRIVKDIINNRV